VFYEACALLRGVAVVLHPIVLKNLTARQLFIDPGDLGIAGVYIFEPGIFEAIHDTKPGFKGEYQLTDSIKALVEQGARVVYKRNSGIHIDVGTPEDLMRANEFYLKGSARPV